MAKKSAFGVRLEPEERAALERAARDDDRALSSFVRRIVVEWLTANGYPPKPAAGDKPAPARRAKK